MDGPPPRPRSPIFRFPLHLLLIPLVLLAVSTAALLVLHAEAINIPLLWSQCSARSRVPWLSHAPALGTPLCFLVSFYQEAVASARARDAVVAPLLAFVAALLTVSAVESARACNRPARLIVHATAPWLAFNLVGGALVWELAVLPAFFVRGRQIVMARRDGSGGGDGDREGGAAAAAAAVVEASHPERGLGMRHLATAAEGIAIPLAVAVGCVLPSVLMLALRNSVVVLVWLFFPVWVSLVRRVVRACAVRLDFERLGTSLHLEASRAWTCATYAVPVLCSVLAHGLMIWSLAAGRDDRKEMTRAATTFIAIDAGFLALTVLYWLFVEAGWRAALVMLLASVVLGPGAGVCLAWVYREAKVDPDQSVTVVAVGARAPHADPLEETPLLR